MIAYARLIGQFAVILLLFSAVAAFANWPVYRQVPEGSAIIVLTFVHGADRKAECRKLSAEEIAKLPPNMRKLQDCPRGRRPIYVELDLSGRDLFRAIAAADRHCGRRTLARLPALRGPGRTATRSPCGCAIRRAPRASITSATRSSRSRPIRCSSSISAPRAADSYSGEIGHAAVAMEGQLQRRDRGGRSRAQGAHRADQSAVRRADGQGRRRSRRRPSSAI